MKTSLTDPLRIASVTPRGTGGAIGMTLCPGRRGAAASGVWQRDLALDLEIVRAWRPDLSIALLEAHEFVSLGIPDFRRDVREAGLPWEFAELRDGGTPDAAFLATWETLGARARELLQNDGRVLVHCKAGLGRTGMLAAMLLVDFGESAASAIARVRAARSPEAIEYAQELYLRSYRPAR